MKEGFANFAFALFAALLLAGGVFAANSTATSANKAPVITSVGGPTSLSAGTAGTWTVSAYDPDSSYLSYSVNWGDGIGQAQQGQSETDSIATFQHTYSAAGTYTITFTATDGAGAKTVSSVTTTVTAASNNHPPTFSSVSCPVTAKSVTCYVYASDQDADTVTYTINFGDNAGQVAGMQNVFAHTYQMAGAYAISIEAKDKYGASVGTALQITVTGNENQKPIISSVSGPSTLSTGAPGTWKVSAYDPDGTYLSYSVVWGDAGEAPVYHTETGSSAAFQHAYGTAGSYMITFTVTDASGASAQNAAYVNVGSYSSGCDSSFNQLMVGQMLQVPPMTNTYGVKLIDISADSDRAAMVQILDSNEAVLDYAKVAPGIKYIYAGKNGNLAIETCKATSASNDVNSAWIKGAITTSSGTDLCAGYHTLVQDQVLDVGTFYVRLDGVSTAQGIAASQRYANIEIITPAGVTLEKKAMYPGETYTYAQSGTSNSVTVKLCDTAYGTSAGKKWVKIDATAVTGSNNLPPVITGVGGPTSISAGTAGTWKISAYDPDGTYLSYKMNWGDGSGTTKSGSGSEYATVTFEHTYSKAGTYTVTFTVADVSSATTQSTLTVAVGGTSTQCTDSDGGLDGYVFGATKNATFSMEDTCIDSNHVLEGYCSGNGVYSSSTYCIYGCSSGVCKIQGKGLEIVDVWVSPDKYNANSNIFYVNLLDNGKVATGSDIEASYALTTPNGGKWSGKMSLGDENNPYITMGIGSGDGCGTYSYTVTAKRISAGGTGAGNYAEKSGTFVLSPPYCTPSTKKISLKFEKGWNMVSNPNTGNLKVSEIAQKCRVSSNAWAYIPSSNSYAAASFLAGGMGYWLYASEACSFDVSPPYIEKLSLGLNAGWNMIGASASEAKLNAGNCKITSGPWNYSPSAGQYVASSTLEPAKGYWVKAAADCTCTLGSASDVPPSAPSG